MLIAIEGIDAAGKHTQADLLKNRITAWGLRATVLSFPRYGATFFSASIADYLNGALGDLNSVPPQLAALLYAGDRLESRQLIAELAQANDVVIFDRYVASNVAYQSAKLSGERRAAFAAWVARLEYEVYGLPRADLTVYLDVSAEVSNTMVFKKRKRSYTDEATDLHERDLSYLAACREVYHALAREQFYSTWVAIESFDKGGIRPKKAISAAIWEHVEPLLKQREHAPPLHSSAEAAGASPTAS